MTHVLTKTVGSYSAGTAGTLTLSAGQEGIGLAFMPYCNRKVTLLVVESEVAKLRPRTREYNKPNRATRREGNRNAAATLANLRAKQS